MPFSDSNRASLTIIPESVFGTTPASGNPRLMRITSSSLAASKETVVSDELRSDRMVSSVVETAAMSEGDINYEFSAGSQDDLFQAFLLATWTKQMTFDKFIGDSVSADTTANNFVISGQGDLTRYFTVGNFIKVSGFANPLNNAYWEIAALNYSAPDFEITVDVTKGDLATEVGNAAVALEDANDVISSAMLKINDVTSSATTSSFDKVGMFTSAITAQALNVGQNVHVEGWGYEAGAYTIAGDPVDAETLTLRDGLTTDATTKTIVLEWDDDSSVTAGNVAIAIATGDDTTMAATVAAAINAQHVLGNIKFQATSAAGVVTIKNLRRNNGNLAESSTNVTVSTPFAGGQTWGETYRITSLENDKMTVTPAPPTNSAGAFITFKGSMVRNPSGIGLGNVNEITAQSFSIETSFNDVDQYLLHDGMRCGSFGMEVASGGIVTGTFAFQGLETQRFGTEQFPEGAYEPLSTTITEVMNATTNVGSISKNGAELATAVQSISLEGDATLRNQNAVSSKFPRGIGTGRFNLTGTISSYFEDGTMYDHFLQHDTIALGWDFNDIDSNKYIFTVPSLKITSDPVSPAGIDQDVMEELEFVAFRDPITKCMLQIDRLSSISATIGA